jgi:hypothetical protein
MEISNKVFGVICVAIVVVTVVVRAQSMSHPAPVAAVVEEPKVVTQAPKKHHGIPNSALPPDPFAASTDDQSAVADAPVTVDNLPPETPPATEAPAAPPKVDEAPADAANGGNEDMTYTDDLGPETDGPPPAPNGIQFSDRDVLRIMLASMPPEQRESFRLMWFTMGPDDRQEVIDQLREQLQSIQQSG